MVILIAGSTHTGKTLFAQKILEKHRYPYLSIDHLKMGLIRSGNTSLTVYDDEELTEYLWPIVREIVKTAIENGQNLTVEGCYIPFDWRKDFSEEYLKNMDYRCLVMTEGYIRAHFSEILAHENDIERRPKDCCCTEEALLEENAGNLAECRKHGLKYVLIENEYRVEADF